MVENLPAVQETWVWSLDWKDPLEEGMAIHSSILAWRIPMGRGAWQVQFMGSQGVGHDWATEHSTETWNVQGRESREAYDAGLGEKIPVISAVKERHCHIGKVGFGMELAAKFGETSWCMCVCLQVCVCAGVWVHVCVRSYSVLKPTVVPDTKGTHWIFVEKGKEEGWIILIYWWRNSSPLRGDTC